MVSSGHVRCRNGLHVLRTDGPWPGRDRPAVRHRSFRDLVQRGRAAALRPRHALPAFVLVSRVQGDIRGGAQGRSGMRHRLLGHRAEPAQQSACPAARRQSSARPCRHPEGQGGRRQDAARARFHRCAGRVLYRLRQGRPWRARAGLSQGHGGGGADAIPTTTKRRSSTPSRSTSRPRPATRPMPISSRARRSWSRSSSASRGIPASPTI